MKIAIVLCVLVLLILGLLFLPPWAFFTLLGLAFGGAIFWASWKAVRLLDKTRF